MQREGFEISTGYTTYIKDGDITTGKEFLKKCICNFGVCIDMKDDSLSEELLEKFEPINYYEKSYNEALATLEKAKSLTSEEAGEIIKKKRSDEFVHLRPFLRIFS